MRTLLLRLLRLLQNFLQNQRASKPILRVLLHLLSLVRRFLSSTKAICVPRRPLEAAQDRDEHQLVFRPAPSGGEEVALANICASRAPERSLFGPSLTAPSSPVNSFSNSLGLDAAGLGATLSRYNVSLQHLDLGGQAPYRQRHTSTPNLGSIADGPRLRTSSRASRRTAFPNPSRSSLALSMASRASRVALPCLNLADRPSAG